MHIFLFLKQNCHEQPKIVCIYLSLIYSSCWMQGYEPPVLVFVQTKERAKELFRELIYDNITVDAIHAERTQKQVHTAQQTGFSFSVLFCHFGSYILPFLLCFVAQVT